MVSGEVYVQFILSVELSALILGEIEEGGDQLQQCRRFQYARGGCAAIVW